MPWKKALFFSIIFLAILTGKNTMAQPLPPNAGRVLQEEMKVPPPAPSVEPETPLDLSAPLPAKTAPGGKVVTIKKVTITGNTIFTTKQLQAVMGETADQTYDLAGLRGLADRITLHYREAGYLFARCYLPAQNLKDGNLELNVLEGRYGQITTSGDPHLTTRTGRFLTNLKPNTVITSAPLERALLLIDYQPGMTSSAVLRPGSKPGTGDLDVAVKAARPWDLSLEADNHGNRYNGRYRGRIDAAFYSPFIFGDQLQLSSLLSDEDMWLGGISYDLPIGSSGWRAKLGYAHTDYELGKEFDDLDVTGYAKILGLELSYALIRSQKRNLLAVMGIAHKELQDKYGITNTVDNKESMVLPLNLHFNMRDSLLGGGVTYGSLGWTWGHLNLEGSLKTIDQQTASTDGDFSKFTLELARVQNIGYGFSFYVGGSSQWTEDNLDSSEGFGLGGPYGVRAYPLGEGYGDRGWWAQTELRYQISILTPYLFYDLGRTTFNSDPWSAGYNHRKLAGCGIGLRGQWRGLGADVAVAWRSRGGSPQSDSHNRDPQIWFSLDYKF
jgi:hemolysin activation/secretion protein